MRAQRFGTCLKQSIASVVLLFGLTSCTPAPVPEPVPAPVFRDVGRMIASKALFDPVEFSGDWHVVASFPDAHSCPYARMSIQIKGSDVTEQIRCPTAEPRIATGRITGPGRWTVPAGQRWVLWADETYRTAVIGTPDGTMGWILNRGAQIPADRLKAAREILDFNGYDVSRLAEGVR